MVSIAPFRAVRYSTAVDLAKVTSPPNDIIPPDERDAYAEDPHNIVHIILPAAADGDADYPGSPNKYERARQHMAAWLADGTFVRDGRPAYYLYEIRHGPADARRTMRGFFCRIGLDPSYTHIKRHERTLRKKARDRLNLKETTQADTESIWLLYRDERGWVDEVLTSNAFDELLRFTDEDGAEHVVWRVDRPEAVTEITAQFEDRDVVIADGHHRYQVALDHYANTGRDEDASLLVCLVRDTDPGLRIEPTHRLVQGLDLDLDAALGVASGHWDAEPLDLPEGDAVQGAWLRGLVDTTPDACIVLGLRDGTLAAHLLRLRPGSRVDKGRGRLDTLHVTRVHERLLEPWGVTTENVEDHLRYTRTATEAVQAVASGRFPLAVMLAGEDVDSVLDVASDGHVMPQKATYFVPKLRSGLVLGPLDEPRPVDWRKLAGDGGPRAFRLPPLD